MAHLKGWFTQWFSVIMKSFSSFHSVNLAASLSVTSPRVLGIFVINCKDQYTIFSNVTYSPQKAKPLICFGPWDQITVFRHASEVVSSQPKVT